MPREADNSTLTDRHYITLILRLTVNSTGELIQGNLINIGSALPKHFIGMRGLYKAVEASLQEHPPRSTGRRYNERE